MRAGRPTSHTTGLTLPSRIFAVWMKEVRAGRGWSQQNLADRLNELGVPLDRASVNKIENGRRGISLDEALAISAGLDAPLRLVLSLEASASFERDARIKRLRRRLEIRWPDGKGP